MRNLDLTAIVRATDGKVFSTFEKEFSGIGTDTREDLKGKLFIALKGDSFDAHEFLDKAVEQGAAALLVHRFPENLESLRAKVTLVVVKDTLVALQQMAQFYRLQSKATYVAITGSNGKTTSKEFSAAVLSTAYKVHYSKGSFNNHWGVPFSILQEPAGTEVTVLEMGMNHPGEIQRLCEIANPDIVVCSMVGRAHIEHFGTVEKIAEAKEEIYNYAPASARRIYNLDNPWTQKMFLKARASFPKSDRIISFSQMNPKADVFLQIEKMTMASLGVRGTILGNSGSAEIPVFGAQNLTNVMVAASVAVAVGLKPELIWPALSHCRTHWGRNQILRTSGGAEILFDGYNANPDSYAALLANIPLLSPGKKIGVFGEMLELGNLAGDAHKEIGELAGRSGFDVIWFYGEHAKDFEAGARSAGFNQKLVTSTEYREATAKNIAADVTSGSMAVVKGSRGMKMEKFVLLCNPLDFSLNKEA